MLKTKNKKYIVSCVFQKEEKIKTEVLLKLKLNVCMYIILVENELNKNA